MLALLTLLADEAPKPPPPGFDFLPLLLIGFAFIVFMVLPMRRERKQRQEMISSIEKGDKVVVNGAFVGTVAQVIAGDEKGQEGELVIKIDENSNVRMRVLRSGVTRVIKDKKDSKDGA